MKRVQVSVGKTFASTPAKASNYIARLLSLITPGVTVVLLCRVSAREKKRERLEHQMQELTEAIEKRGGVVLRCFKFRASGWRFDAEYRQAVKRAARYAQSHNAVLVAFSVDRFLRARDFHHRNNPNAQPTDEDFQRFLGLVGDVQLATLVDPDASPKKVRQARNRASRKYNRDPGGRPPKPSAIASAEDESRLIDIIFDHNRKITPRQLMRSTRRYKTTAEAVRALTELGMLRQRHVTKGRPSIVYRWYVRVR
jgi:hypothetical protein